MERIDLDFAGSEYEGTVGVPPGRLCAVSYRYEGDPIGFDIENWGRVVFTGAALDIDTIYDAPGSVT